MFPIDLNNLLGYISSNLNSRVTVAKLHSYEIFGKEVEEILSDLIEEFLTQHSIVFTSKRAKTKNDFPDLKLTINGINYAFEYKCGASDEGPNNDLGTINAYPDKISLYEDNIYCVFVKYQKANSVHPYIQVLDVYLDKIYTFVGLSNPNVLKYRKKDGNLRPKVWNDFSNDVYYVQTLNHFKQLLKTTTSYRAYQLVLQHLEDITEEDKTLLYKRLMQDIEKNK